MKNTNFVVIAIILSIFNINVFAQETTGIQLKKPLKKIVSSGWEFGLQRPVDFPEIAKQLKDGPYDGIALGFEVVSTEDPNFKCVLSNAWKNVRWKKEWFKKNAELLKSTPKGKLTDNFIRVYLNTAYGSKDPAKDRLRWDNDEQWASFANNLGVLAWFVKESGFKGLMFDPEDFANPKVNQYTWKPSDGDYLTTCKLARKRGAQIMKAITKEYPDITLYYYWFISFRMDLIQSENPDLAAAQRSDLWIPFINGMLDSITPNTKIIDGYTNYHIEGKEFKENYILIKSIALSLIVPENKEKFINQVQYCPTLYMAMYFNPEGSDYYWSPLGGSRILRFLNILSDSLNVSDNYVILWSEAGEMRNWKPKNGKLANHKLFDDLLPGTENAMKLAKNPIEQGKAELKELKAQGNAVNLAKNSDMSQAAVNNNNEINETPAGYTFLQNNNSNGVFYQDTTTGYSDNFSAKILGVGGVGVFSQDLTTPYNDNFAEKTTQLAGGCLSQIIDVKQYEWYIVEALGKKTGGFIFINVRWKNEDGNWLKTYDDVDLYFTDDFGKGWKRAISAVRVPKDAAKMVVELSMSNQSSTDACWFDDLGIYQIR